MRLSAYLSVLGLSLLLVVEVAHGNSLIRVRRVTPEQFNNAHVMSQKTYGELSRSPNPGKHWHDFTQKMNAKVPSASHNNYHQRPVHTMIIGGRDQVASSIKNGNHLPAQGQFALLNNMHESNQKFPQIKINRLQNAPNKDISSITNLGNKPFAAGVNNNIDKKPVHYQNTYLKPVAPGSAQNHRISTGVGGMPIWNNPNLPPPGASGRGGGNAGRLRAGGAGKRGKGGTGTKYSG